MDKLKKNVTFSDASINQAITQVYWQIKGNETGIWTNQKQSDNLRKHCQIHFLFSFTYRKHG